MPRSVRGRSIEIDVNPASLDVRKGNPWWEEMLPTAIVPGHIAVVPHGIRFAATGRGPTCLARFAVRGSACGTSGPECRGLALALDSHTRRNDWSANPDPPVWPAAAYAPCRSSRISKSLLMTSCETEHDRPQAAEPVRLGVLA